MIQQVAAEVENAKSVIRNLRYIFTDNEKKRVLEKSGIDVIYIINLLSILENQILVPDKFMLNDKFLEIIYRELPRFSMDLESNIARYQNDSIEFGANNIMEIRNICQKLLSILCSLTNNNKNLFISKSYNSETYYEQQISELKSSKSKLEKQLSELQKTKEQLSEVSQDQKTELQQKENDISQTKVELAETLSRLSDAEKELEEKRKQEDAQKNWSEKIESTFKNLSSLLDPISKEYSRLSTLYYIYMVLSGSIIILLLVLEIILCKSLSQENDYPQLLEYIPYYVPIPISGALLWAFIVQMNRAQRQLVILAERIHHIKYIEGLLLSLNTLAPNIEDAVKRINSAMDKLIKGHLSSQNIIHDEESILNEERKDALPIDIVIKLLETIKSTTK